VDVIRGPFLASWVREGAWNCESLRSLLGMMGILGALKVKSPDVVT
jgi:hypothetical protein